MVSSSLVSSVALVLYSSSIKLVNMELSGTNNWRSLNYCCYSFVNLLAVKFFLKLSSVLPSSSIFFGHVLVYFGLPKLIFPKGDLFHWQSLLFEATLWRFLLKQASSLNNTPAMWLQAEARLKNRKYKKINN